MHKIVIVYDSITGNTEMMAKAVAEGAKTSGVQVEVYKIGARFAMSLLNDADAIIFGSPAEYGNVTSGMRSFLESIVELKTAKKLRVRGKVGGVFGSYTYDGGWVVDMLGLRMRKLGIRLVPPIVSAVDHEGAMGVHINENSLRDCRQLGKAVAARIEAKS